MELARLAAIVLALGLCAPAIAAGTEELQSVARQIGEEIDNPSHVRPDLYAPSFLQAVPAAQLSALYASMHGSYGPIRDMPLRSHEAADQGTFDLVFDTVTTPMTLVIEPEGAHRVTGLWFGPAVPRLLTWAQLQQQFAALPGKASFQLQRLDDPAVVASYHPDESLAIGSAFKLFILASLLDQKFPWDRIVRVDDRLKSLPSGNMRTWPAGSPVTVSTLAIKMISQSDNTAADHLLALAGRKNVETILTNLGMAKPAADIPFLSTREAFALKADAGLRKKYLAADDSGRRAILDRIATEPMPDLADLSTPTAIDTIEWFASGRDLCRVMQWFDRQNNPTALGILAVNPGLALSDETFSYIGYKGGSEPGVLCMTWLLHARDGRHYAMAGVWNDSSKDVDLQKLAGLMQAAAEMIGKNP
jgi:beta-lactamase class A